MKHVNDPSYIKCFALLDRLEWFRILAHKERFAILGVLTREPLTGTVALEPVESPFLDRRPQEILDLDLAEDAELFVNPLERLRDGSDVYTGEPHPQRSSTTGNSAHCVLVQG